MHEIKKINTPVPSKKERDFIETLEGQIQAQMTDSIQKMAYIESAILSWATIEQIFLPRMINFITKNLKLEIPNSIFENKTAGPLIDLYLCLSHDRELYALLKKASALRNKLIHSLYKEGDLRKINRLALDFTTMNVDSIYGAFLKRFDGTVQIPVLTLYGKGWNDFRKESLKRLEKLRTAV